MHYYRDDPCSLVELTDGVVIAHNQTPINPTDFSMPILALVTLLHLTPV